MYIGTLYTRLAYIYIYIVIARIEYANERRAVSVCSDPFQRILRLLYIVIIICALYIIMSYPYFTGLDDNYIIITIILLL